MNAKPPRAPRAIPLAMLLRDAAIELRRQVPPPWPSQEPPSVTTSATASAAPHRHVGLPAAGSPWRLRAWRWSGAAVLALALPLAVAIWLQGGEPPDLAVAASAEGFVPVVPAERWRRLAGQGAAAVGWLVATELPAERLAAYGLPYDPARAADPVPAELLMNPAGEVLALRIVHPLPRNSR